MKALIIGAAGFVGSYLAEHLIKEYGWETWATKLPIESFSVKEVKVCNLDILDSGAIQKILEETQPDYIFHLAAQSSVAYSWEHPALTLDINIKGCVNLLESIRKIGIQPRTLLIGSSEEYGRISDGAVAESIPLHPENIYAATKACQNMLGRIYANAYHMEVIMVRAFNHIGPGQASIFVISDFCRQVAEIEKGLKEPVIRVGNLSAQRDFTDVRDIVRAYALLAQKGTAGETYNVGSGTAISIQEVLEKILLLSNTKINIEIDPKKLRPIDVPTIEADISKLKEETGWQKEIKLENTLRDTLEYWREKLDEGCI